MRNTKLIVAMLAGCMAVSGAALAQDASKSSAPMSSSTAATPTHTTSDAMKKTGTDSESMSQDPAKSGSDSMKSTHKKHKKSGTSAEPAKSSTSGM